MHHGIVLDPEDIKILLRGGRLTIQHPNGGDLDIWAVSLEKVRMIGRRPTLLREVHEEERAAAASHVASNGTKPGTGIGAHGGGLFCECGQAFRSVRIRAAHIANRTRAGESGHGVPRTERSREKIVCLCGDTFGSGFAIGTHLRKRKQYPDGRTHGYDKSKSDTTDRSHKKKIKVKA